MQIPLANIHWRFLLVRDDWGFQVNPLCRHDITRSDRQIGNYSSSHHIPAALYLVETERDTAKKQKASPPHLQTS